MTKLLSISILGILLTIGNPIEELKEGKPPTKEQAEKLNHTAEDYEVFFNKEDKVEYREYEPRRVKQAELPFEIRLKKEDIYVFGGRQVNLKVDTGWLVGFDKGEWGGNLFWFNEDGSNYEKIAFGNIKNLFAIDGQFFVTEGLAHLSMSDGQIFKVEKKNNEWRIEKKVDLPDAPYATTLTKDNEFLIVTSKGLLKVNKEFKIETLVEEGFWSIYLYPNTILVEGQNIYIGMRGGVLRTQIDQVENQQWLTKK